MPPCTRTVLGLITAVLGFALVGCTLDETESQVAAMNASNIQRVSNLYAGFQNMKSSKGPKSESEFKEFIQSFDPIKLEMMGIDTDDRDTVFISERDGQPFKVKYNVGGGRGSVAPVVFESVGKDGKKQVGFTGGKVEDVDEARYQELWSGKSRPDNSNVGSGFKDTGRPRGRPPGAPQGPGR